MKTNVSIDKKHYEPGFRFENDWPSENLEYISQNYKAGETIPVEVTIETEQHVLNLDQVKRILRTAHTISLMDCYCRLTYGHCAAPVKVCLDLNHVAERHIAEFGAQEISFEEALQVLEQSHEAGLVHMAYGHGDLARPWKGAPPRHVGCFELLNRLWTVRPKVHVFGHIISS